jgi:hypothetical protein
MVVLALSMRSARYLIVFVALVLLMPAKALAGAPQIYARSGSGYTVALKAEGSRVSVLALDAPIYCTFEPREQFRGTMSMFQGPTLMRPGRRGLEARLRPNAGPASYIDAILHGNKFSGAFAFDVTEESTHCQTAGFDPTRPAVRFEAVPYEPAGGSATKAPTKGETPIYYGNEGGIEVLLENARDQVEVRGAAPARCPIAGKEPAGGRAPLFNDVTDAARGNDGSFLRTVRSKGKIGGRAWKESRSISGVVGSEEIAGFYVRSTTIQPAKGPPRHCTTGSLPFRALRYLPAAGS